MNMTQAQFIARSRGAGKAPGQLGQDGQRIAGFALSAQGRGKDQLRARIARQPCHQRPSLLFRQAGLLGQSRGRLFKRVPVGV
jgi:hypothetical protein